MRPGFDNYTLSIFTPIFFLIDLFIFKKLYIHVYTTWKNIIGNIYQVKNGFATFQKLEPSQKFSISKGCASRGNMGIKQ
jgi:hypothetical protein